jgi:hypothetical protein
MSAPGSRRSELELVVRTRRRRHRPKTYASCPGVPRPLQRSSWSFAIATLRRARA